MVEKKSRTKIVFIIASSFGAAMLGLFTLIAVYDYFLLGGNDPRCNDQGMYDLAKVADRLEIEGISDQEFVGFSGCDSGGVPTFEIYTTLNESEAEKTLSERWECKEFTKAKDVPGRTFNCSENGQEFELELETGSAVWKGERYITISFPPSYKNAH
jgi:hypothetical protein